MALLERVRSFAADKGPEFIGDILGPVAKWSIFFANALLQSNEELKQVVSHVFGMSTQLVQNKPRTSPLRLLISRVRFLSDRMSQDAKTMATLHIRIRSACTLSVLVLLNVALMAGVGWRWVTAFHLGMYAYNWGQVEAQGRSGKETLPFLTSHTFLCMCDAVATPATLMCRFVVHMLGSIMVVCLGLTSCDATFPCFVACTLLIWLYTPLWFGVCAGLAFYPLLICLGEVEEPALGDCLRASAVVCGVLCFARMLLYVSSGGFCGALLLFLVPWVLDAATGQENAATDMVAPLPLVCALLACFYLPFWVGASFISTVVCSFALACCNNVLAILWWIVSFATLQIVSSYTSCKDFSVLTVCLLGSFFSYGCILA